jgi:hypothetical protein
VDINAFLAWAPISARGQRLGPGAAAVLVLPCYVRAAVGLVP